MGISGLLPLLKKASKNCHVRRFSGCTVAVDAFCWLHKGAFGCAAQLGKGEPTVAYVTYCLKYINVLLAHGVKPVLVFDGRSLPAKAVTDNKRRQKREENRKQAQKCLREGKNKEAWECFTRCVEITTAMTRELIKVLRQQHIDYIIAPYEADAQLAYLSRNGLVDIVITEDSDLVLFGCSKIFFKMNVNGDGVLFDNSKLAVCMGLTPDKFQLEHLRRMCILSGCDYLPSLPGIGLGKAKKVFMPPPTSDIRTVLNAVPQLTQLKINVPEEYILAFIEAENTFMYQLAFDPISRTLVPLTPYPSDINSNELTYAGAYVDKSVISKFPFSEYLNCQLALDMALGNVDVKTQERVDNFNPCLKTGYKETSMWSKDYKIPGKSALVLEDKKQSKNRNTGLKISHSVGSSLKKRQIDCQNSEEKDEDILALYQNKDSESSDNESSAKRIRLIESEGDHGGGDEEDLNIKKWANERILRSRSNPFIKSPEQKNILTESDQSQLETSPPKYKRQQKENDDHITVKSKYFKSLTSPSKPIIEDEDRKILSPSIMTRSFYKKRERNCDTESESPISIEDPILESENEDDVEFIGSQTSSYFSSESQSPPVLLNDKAVNNKSPMVTLTRLTQSFGNLRSATPKMRTPVNCRRVGLSKGLRNKRDPNQKSIMELFSAKPKSKI